ncbi:MAG: peroxiredoxin [Bacteroidetes bacterium]|nr:peroxiredoxin [Bacteroidota bacterium]
MKKFIIILPMFFISCFQVWSQGTAPQLGDVAPSFTAETTNGKLHFPGDYSGSWKILFSHPADFTPVCSSEILELGVLQDDFNKLGTKLVVLSTDALDKHNQWIASMETIRYKDREPVKLKFPLVADEDHLISKKYGMIHTNTNTTRDVRGVFIIDPSNKVRALFYYPMEVGRNMDEIKRTLVALQTADQAHVLTPANWRPGDDVLVNATKTEATTSKPTDPNVYQIVWYMTFKKMN